ncbi:hypothetical protein AB0F43_15835 [Kribbella sp. NPDC023972]|uniref:hypothetical protein n=1 Tax=Kribbella sp. NPDC023972 TaxID=3154795 RepID=UPI0033FED868
MKVLAWLAFPLVATGLAMCWAAWRGRSRGPRRSGGAFASVEDFRRFNEALAAPGPRATPDRRRGLLRRTRKNLAADTPEAGETVDRSASATATDFGGAGAGTPGAAGALESAGTLSATRKLGSAETFGSTKIAGQGS